MSLKKESHKQHLFPSHSYSSLASQATLTDEGNTACKGTSAAETGSHSSTCLANAWQTVDLTIPQDQSATGPSSSSSNVCEEQDRPDFSSVAFLDRDASRNSEHENNKDRGTSCNSSMTISGINERTLASETFLGRQNSLRHHPFIMLPAGIAPTPECTEIPSPSGSDDVAQPKDKKEKVIILLGQCLLNSGCPCHRTEDALQHTANLLGIYATFSLLPESILITFLSSEQEPQSVMIRCAQALDMGKIGRVQRIMDDYFRRKHDQGALEKCIRSLENVETSPPTWGIFGTCFAFSAGSFSAAVLLFDGSWVDASISGALGLLVAALFILSAYFPIYGRVFEISSCVIVAALARLLHAYCCFTSVAVSAMLILLPGYAMTMAVMELSARHVTTGTIRLVYAVFYAFLLAYGFQMGSRVYTSIAGEEDTSTDDSLCGVNPVSPWFYILMLPLLSVSISMSYGSSVKQWPAQFGGALLTFCLSYFMGKLVVDPPVVNSMAAFVTGVYSHLVLKLSREPPLISLSVGITLLVPGSIGVKGAYALLHQEDMSQTIFPLQMVNVALGLAAGLFASAMIVYPAGKRGSMLLSL